jgi:hypothetical protein
MENVLFFTLGVFLVSGGTARPGAAIRDLARQPIIWALLAAILVRSHPAWIPGPVSVAAGILGAGLVPLALVTLGAQLVATRRSAGRDGIPGRELPLIVGLRLVTAPVVAWGLVRLLGIPAASAPVLVAAAGYPCAVNSVILAIEFKRAPRLASASVFWTTLASAVTVTAVLASVR